MDARGEESLSGFLITADRGYEKMSMIRSLARKGIGFIFIMPEHLLRCHPFVGDSQFDPAKLDIDESDAEDGSDAASDSIPAQYRNSSMLYDRENAFIIDENPKMGNLCKRAEKLFKDKDTGVRTRVTAVALRERGTKKFAKTLRFVYSLPSSLSKLINCWVAVPRSMSMSESLFTKRANDGTLIVPPATSHDKRELVESHCLNNTVVLTVDQRCADWFVLRQFHITGTVAGTILMNNPETLSHLGIKDVECHERTMAESFQLLAASWISTSRSTEGMMRGTVTENAAMNAIRSKPFVRAIFPCGMFGDKQYPWLACSPDGVALIDLHQKAFNTTGDTDPLLHVCSVEIKTSIAPSSLSTAVSNASVDLLCIEMGTFAFLDRVPRVNIGQILQQMVVLRVSYVLYVVCSEVALLSCTLINAPSAISEEATRVLELNGNCLQNWAFYSPEQFPPFVAPDIKKVLKWRLLMWKVMNTSVQNRQPFVPLKLFKHGVQ